MVIFNILFSILLLGSSSDAKAISYPKEECDWIGADGRHGPYLPIGVCKHIFNPYNLSTPVDDHRYSQKYVCSDDGSTVHSLAYMNNSNCAGDNYHTLPAKIYGDDYFGCSASNRGACPYSVVRFYHQMSPNDDTCTKSDDGWYSEAPNNVYQCLNNSHGWFMLECTADGRGLIGIEYTENCEEKLNETVFYDGCQWKGKYIEITHCDYWEGAHPETTSAAAMTTAMSTTNPAISAVSTALGMDGGCGEEHMHHDHMHRGHSHSDSLDDHHRKHHHGYHEHGPPDSDDGPPLPPPGPQKTESSEWIRWFIVASGCGLLFMALCCCMTYKYLKQKKEIAEFKVIVNEQCADTNKDGEESTICLDEGEPITFK